MSVTLLRSAAAVLALVASAWPGAALAQTSATRSSGFAYDASSGLLTQEVIEPSQSAYRLQTDYAYNAFGQKVQVTVSGVDITTRSASTTYDTRGCRSASNPDPPKTPAHAEPYGATLRCAPPGSAPQLHNLGSGQLFDADPGHGFGAV